MAIDEIDITETDNIESGEPKPKMRHRVRSSGTKTSRRPTRRMNVGWLVAAAACFVLAAGWVLWALTSASDRTEVLVVTSTVESGELVPASAVGTASVALDPASRGRFYLPSQRSDIIGAVAAVDLEPGDLLGPAVLDRAPDTTADEETVGALLPAGRYPDTIKSGDSGRVVFTPEAADPVEVRVLSAEKTDTNQLSVVFAVDADDAPQVARWAGNGEMALTVIEAGSRP